MSVGMERAYFCFSILFCYFVAGSSIVWNNFLTVRDAS